jgi:putative transposase
MLAGFLDEVQLKIKGKRYWLWRAVDKHGVVLDILVQQRRDKLTRGGNVPTACAGGGRVRAVGGDHRQARELSTGAPASATQHGASTAQRTQQPSGAENSNQPTRQRERAMRRFKSTEQAPRFLGPFGAVDDHFRTGRYRTSANARRQLLAERRRTSREVVGLPPVA